MSIMTNEMPASRQPETGRSRQEFLADLGLAFGADEFLVQALIGVGELVRRRGRAGAGLWLGGREC